MAIRWPATLPDDGSKSVTPGAKYKLQYRTGFQRKEREAVMRFIGFSVKSGRHPISVWNCPPAGGNLTLPIESVSNLEEVPPDCEEYFNRTK